MSDNSVSVSLTLNASHVVFTKPNPPHYFYESLLASTTDGFTSTDEEGVKLAQELNKEPISVQVDLLYIDKRPKTTHGASWLYDLRFKSNVLQVLRDQFMDEVKCSVYLTPTPGWTWTFSRVDAICAERMTICPDTYTCISRLASFDTSFTNCMDYVRWDLTITIHIPITAEPQTSQTILDEELFSDLVISAGNGAEIKAHKSFLSAASPILRATFTNKTKESLTGTLDMTDMSEKSVWAFLRYIYTKDLAGPKKDAEIAFDLLRAAHKYAIPKLEILMATQLSEADEEGFGAVLAFRMYSFVKVWDSTSGLKEKAIRVLKAKWEEFIISEEYRELLKDVPKNSVDEFFMDVVKS